MLNKTTEKVFCTLKYEANDNPKCRILVDGKVVHDFKARTDEENFSFDVNEGPFEFRILQYNKNMKKDTKKFIEVKAIYFKQMIYHLKIRYGKPRKSLTYRAGKIKKILNGTQTYT